MKHLLYLLLLTACTAVSAQTKTFIDEYEIKLMMETEMATGPDTIYYHIGGQYLLDPNEINGWGSIGPTDNTNNQDLGNVGGAALSRASGGIMFPYDVEVIGLTTWHQNSSTSAQPWGWVLARQSKTAGANTVTTSFILDESTERVGIDNGAGLRDYSSTTTQYTDLSISTNNTVPAGEVMILAVGAPTANATNYYVRIHAGYLTLVRQ